MACKGHEGKPDSCYFPVKTNSFWDLCVSCERIENRLFLDAVQRAIRDDTVTFTFHTKEYSLNDPHFPERYLRHTSFLSTHQDPRLSMLLLLYKSNRVLFKTCVRTFIQDASFIISANLLYRSHLPQQSTCAMLENIQREVRQHFTDLPTCPCCMSKKLLRIERENINHRIIQHVYRIFQNHTLAQHPTWFVWTFKLLQTIWERDLEDIFTFQRMDLWIRENNQVLEFRDWLGAFLETPIVIEKALTGKISTLDREYILLWTGQELQPDFYRRLLKRRQNLYKEELIMRTWHPKRIFFWCFDLEELAEFGPIDHDQLQSSLDDMHP
jgi:hypothetical protein